MEILGKKVEKIQNLNALTMLKIGQWRYPFILVDRITRFTNSKYPEIKGYKNISFNEPYFTGHFPESPIMPGVLIAECLGQISGLLSFILDFCDLLRDQKNTLISDEKTLFQEIETNTGLLDTIRRTNLGVLASQNLKYKSPVFPGDKLELKSILTLKNANFFHHKVDAVVDNKLVASGVIVNYRLNPAASGSGLRSKIERFME